MEVASTLPIDDNTLVYGLTKLIKKIKLPRKIFLHRKLNISLFRYGSGDGGGTVKFDEKVHEKMKDIAKRLNLRPHFCTPLKDGRHVEVALCTDIEAHKDSEGNYFVLGIYFSIFRFFSEKNESDWARIFPPERPFGNRLSKHCFLAHMIRPEYVKT